MITPNTPEELAEAHRQICYMRGIDPSKAESKKSNDPVLLTRKKIEEVLYQKSLENDTFYLQGMNLTGAHSIDPEKRKQLAEAAKVSQFNKPFRPR